MEDEDYEFSRLVRSSFKLVSADGIHAGLSQYWVPTEDAGRLDRPIGGNNSFNLDGSGNPHFLGQRWVVRNDLGHYFAPALTLVLLGVSVEVRNHPRSREDYKRDGDPASHRCLAIG